MKKAILTFFICVMCMHAQSQWEKFGNTIVSGDFLGTLNPLPLEFRINNQRSGRIDFSNTSIGYQSLFGISTGISNSAFGYQALFSHTTGNNNTATGHQALFSNAESRDNTANGYKALFNNGMGVQEINEGAENTAMGSQSLTSNTLGSYNTAAGDNSLRSNTIGNNNTAVGNDALYTNTTGINNTASGDASLYFNTFGNSNTAAGNAALYHNTTGNYNTALGRQALVTNSTGNSNTAVGFQSLYSNTVGSNTATGYQSLFSDVSGAFNTANGHSALYSATSGRNTAVGRKALYTTTSGGSNTAIGYNADVSTGTVTNSTAIGANTVVNANNKMQLGSSATTLATSGAYTIVSDGRFKDEIKTDDVPGLDFINHLQPVTYNFNYKRYDDFLRKDLQEKETGDDYQKVLLEKGKDRHVGFIAQEVEKVCLENKFTFNGIYIPQDGNDNYALDYGRFVVPLVKGMQELSKENEKLKSEIELIKSMLSADKKQKLNEIKRKGMLEQNNPNPFNSQTEIKFQLPAQYNSAQLIIKDAEGNQLRRFDLHSSTSVIIKGGELAAGNYFYSLVIDGTATSTKIMTLTK